MVSSVDFVHPISLIFNPLRVYYIKSVSESCGTRREWKHLRDFDSMACDLNYVRTVWQ